MAHLASEQLMALLSLLAAGHVEEYPKHRSADDTDVLALAARRYPTDFVADNDSVG